MMLFCQVGELADDGNTGRPRSHQRKPKRVHYVNAKRVVISAAMA